MHVENEYRRGDIFFIEKREAAGSEQEGGRPGIIVSNDVGNKHAPIVELVFLTAREKKPMPTHVQIKSCQVPSIALCEQIETVSKERIGKYLGQATGDEMRRVDKALAVSIGLNSDAISEKYIQEWVEALRNPDPEQDVEEKHQDNEIREILQLSQKLKDLERELIRAEAERDVYQKLYKENIGIN